MNTHTKDGRPLLIREATGADAPAVLRYVHHVSSESDFLTFGQGEFEMTEAEEVAFLNRSLANERSLFLLAILDDTIAGVLTFAAGTRSRTQHVGNFGTSVLKANWGQGIGACLLDCLINWARTGQVIKKINLTVRTDNQRAIALYFKKGFEIEGLLKNEMMIHGAYYDLYAMGLML